jgi:hypothetical protein
LTNRSTQKKDKSEEMKILAANAPAILRKKDSTQNLNRKIFEVLQRKQQPLLRTSSRDRSFQNPNGLSNRNSVAQLFDEVD